MNYSLFVASVVILFDVINLFELMIKIEELLKDFADVRLNACHVHQRHPLTDNRP